MGNANPVSPATKREIEELIKAIIATFTLQYTKYTIIGLVRQRARELSKPPYPYHLLKKPRDYDDGTDPRLTGWCTKQGGNVKSMKRRFFVANRNWTIDYFETEEMFKNGKKPKGTMKLAGYTVNDDPNNTLLNRLRKLAEQMGMDLNDLPKPKEWPPEAIEIHHPRRRTWYIIPETMEAKKEWVQMTENCCRYSYGLTNKDEVHVFAFNNAVWATRWELGRWGWWSWGGAEEAVLSDIISDQIDYAIMYKIYGNIKGPWIVRNKIRETVLKTINTAVTAAVNPAWAAAGEAIKILRPKIDPIVKENCTPILELEIKICNTIKDGAMSIINPILAEHVTPHLAKIAEICKSPVVEAFDKAIEIFLTETSALDVKGTTNEEVRRSLQPLSWYSWGWKIWPALEKLDVMYDPLQALSIIFTDLWAWSLIWDIRDKIRKRADSAVYTMEVRLLAAIEANPGLLQDAGALKAAALQVRDSVVEDYRYDAKVASRKFYLRIMRGVLKPAFQKLVVPACKLIVEPLSSTIPDLMKEIVDPAKLLIKVMSDILDASILTCIGE